MALRMKVRGVLGVVVDGRVRDRAELKASGLGIWARGGSTVGSGAEAKAGEMGGEVCVSGVVVKEVRNLLCHWGGVCLANGGMVDGCTGRHHLLRLRGRRSGGYTSGDAGSGPRGDAEVGGFG